MMKTVPAVIVLVGAVLFSPMLMMSAQAQDCPTQGAVALALAQLFGFEVDNVEDAVTALESVDRGEPMTASRISAGLLNPEEVVGVWELTFEALGMPEMMEKFSGLPGIFPGTRHPPKAWYPLEGSIEDGRPTEGPVRRTTRRTTEASPFVP